MKAREVNKALLEHGAEVLRQKGSHRVYRAVVNGQVFQGVVPQHGGDMPKGTARQIERDWEQAFGKGWLK